MLILVFLIFSVLFLFSLSLLHLVVGLFLSKFQRTNRFGIRLIARSMLMPGRCIACRCHQNCETTKCRNWNCENFYHCRQPK